MATMAFPICELAPMLETAKEDTKRVVSYSKSAVADLHTACRILWDTIALRGKFSHLADKQDELINRLADNDLSAAGIQQMQDLAVSIENLIKDERDMLKDAFTLGSEIRVWWGDSLARLADQADYLESIAESLHVAGDAECVSLLALTLEEVAVT